MARHDLRHDQPPAVVRRPAPIWKAWDDFGIADSRMIGWWVPDRPVSTGRADVLATSYQREGRTLVSLASWARDTVDVMLDIKWARLGLDSARATLRAPAVDSFQVATTWRPGQPIRVAPGKGWLIVVQ